ncbi:hypothetical protein BAUCODRAFT_67883 [Baudoinia panamericana UAMH 10762]|uniref:Trafficking protein particle complex subunit 13 n=1 Tax=Baudoinia panamericana (strain UAMH 10762) TaxID=717646 RepID=M2LSX1_BAUPA|nr:uncharacterized protein BAUCODRAFT_67883 [Baudoinia panamericana UAMH 10762]EMC97597.1 hypothetical protein BAUCODRAFT_67883 [Baudoinia panamericana UAMH 10762]
MAQQRDQAVPAPGGPHAVSLKVLRLSRPSLASQTPLPPTNFGHGIDIPPEASVAYPGSSTKEPSTFPLVPLLTLPSAFGAAYVGETFACTLCVNNEIQHIEKRSVSGVRVTAELQTPNDPSGTHLELTKADNAEEGDGELPLATTLQRTLAHELKEEGSHVLAVTVSYTETLRGDDGGASGGRARSFRKLYQFVAQHLIAVRSKATERKRREKAGGRQWVLEAQLENVGEMAAVLEKVWLDGKEGIASRAVNGGEEMEAVVLKPRDIEQVMFLLEEDGGVGKVEDGTVAGRLPLAKLNIEWRTGMGERGSLTTAWLAARGR